MEKNYRLYIVGICLLINNHIYAQPGVKIWDKRFGGTKGESIKKMIATADGGYLLGGYSDSGADGDKTQPSQGGLDYWVVKIDGSGNKVWDKRFGGTDFEVMRSMIATADGGYLLGGYSSSGANGDKTQPSQGYSDYWVVKIDGSGNKIWDKRFGGTDFEDLYSMIATADGGCLLGGETQSGANGDITQPSRGSYDYWVVKIDGSGNKVWDKRFGGTERESIKSMVATSDGGYLLGGYSESGASGDKTQPSQGYSDYWVVKIDGSGNKVWDKRFGGTDGGESISSMIATSDGGYLLGGASGSGANGDKTQPAWGEGDYWVVKIDGSGNKVWDKRFGGTSYEDLESMITAFDGGYLLGGRSEVGGNGDITQPGWGSGDYWVVKIDVNGNKVWDKLFGGSQTDDLRDIVKTADGGYLLGGFSFSGAEGDKTQPSQGSFDYWVVKISGECTLFTASITPSADQNTCAGSNLTFSGSITGGTSPTYTWSSSPIGFSSSLQNPSFTTPTVTQTTNYVLTLTATDAGCTATATATTMVTVNNRPNPPNIIGCAATPTTEWMKKFGGSNYESLNKVLELTDGSLLWIGGSRSQTSGDKSMDNFGSDDTWVIKTDATGNTIIWQKGYGGSAMEYDAAGVATPDGGAIIGITSRSGANGNKSTTNFGDADIWVIKIDANGNIIRQWIFGGDAEDRLSNIIATSDGNYLITSLSYSAGETGNKSGNGAQLRDNRQGDYWVIKFNPNSSDPIGAFIWQRSYGGNGTDLPIEALETSSGDYIVAGWSRSDGGTGNKTAVNFDGNAGLSDYWVLKIKSDGTQILWQQSYGGAKASYNPSGQDYGDDYLYSLTKSNFNGRYIIGGYSKSESSTGNKLTPLRGSFDGWIVEINDSDGSKVGERTIGGANQDIFGKIVGMPNGNGYWVTMKVTNTNSGDITDTPLGMSDIWLAEIDNNLTNFNSIAPRWNRRLGGSLGAYDDIPNNVTLTKSGDLIISGVRASDATNTNGQSQDYFAVKISECSANTNYSICPSTGITLYAIGCSGTINWSNGMTGNNISVNTVGTYTATCTVNAANCPSLASNSIVVSTIPASLTLNNTATSNIQKASQIITSTQTIPSGTNVTYQAGNSVNLQGTFNAQTGSIFKAEIKGCSN